MIPRTREALSRILLRSFPVASDIDAKTVDAFVDTLMTMKVEASARARASGIPAADPAAEHTLYQVRATHARRTPVTSVFTGVTEAVRVALPDDEPRAIESPIGDILPSDHLVPTVASIRERFGARIGRPFERVELVAPPRSAGVRFASMSLYLGYEQAESPEPLFVLFEPGSATGQAMALYLAVPHDAVIEAEAGYAATPFSGPEHVYTGGLRMAPNGVDPDVLYMRASKCRGEEPYLRLHVEYQPVESFPFLMPARGLVEAVLRVLAVQKCLGMDMSFVERVIGDFGLRAVPWIDRPDNAAPPGEPSQETFTPATDYDAFVASLSEDDRRIFQASITMLLSEVVRIDGKFDRLERIEVDWTLNFEVPAALGDTFRFSEAAQAEHRRLFDGAPPADPRPFDERLAHLAAVVERLPEPLRAKYGGFVAKACRSAAESSGGWLWFGAKVSAEEKEVLEKIDGALRLEVGPASRVTA